MTRNFIHSTSDIPSSTYTLSPILQILYHPSFYQKFLTALQPFPTHHHSNYKFNYLKYNLYLLAFDILIKYRIIKLISKANNTNKNEDSTILINNFPELFCSSRVRYILEKYA